MNTEQLILKCYVEQEEGSWVAVCLDLNLAAQAVVLHEQTWDFHFSQLRRDLGKEALIDTLERPEHVLEGTTNPNYVVFLNTRVLSDNSANPLVVIVDPDAQPTPAVASFGHRRDFKDISKHKVLWVPPENNEESSD